MLNNPFSQRTRDLFDMWWWCMDFEDGRSDADCLHHILGRVSNSPYNACPLNNFRNHQPEWRKWLQALSSFEVRSKYLQKTKIYLDDIWYINNDVDKKFLEDNKKYYKNV